MSQMDDMQMKVARLIVEMVELRGPARQTRRQALAQLQRQQDIVSHLLDLVRTDALSFAHRSAAAQLLADWRAAPLLPVLTELADSGIDGLQEVALAALYQFGDPLGIDGLIALLDHPDRSLAGRACDCLGDSRSPRAVAPLAGIVKTADSMVGLRAVNALALYGSDESRAALQECARHRLAPDVAARIRQVLAPQTP